MKNKKNIFIFPGVKNLKQACYHTTVCSYFLSKYLSKYFNIINGGSFLEDPKFIKAVKEGDSKKALEASSDNLLLKLSNLIKFDKNIDYILTTNQRGFSKFKKRNHKQNLFSNLKKKFKKIKFISLHDHSAMMQYSEDILLVALPFSEDHKKEVLRKTKTELIFIGWCADHDVFKDNPKKRGNLNLVLDHAALQDFRADATNLYLKEIKRLKKNYPNKEINLCRIRKGFEFFDFENNKWTHDLAFRWWDSDYDDGWANDSRCHIFQIAECLNNSHIFCVTHVESCGLTGIEALMAGCKLYIPKGKDTFNIWGTHNMGSYKGPFLKKALLKPYMDYDIFKFNNPVECFKLLKRDIDCYKIKYNRKLLIEENSWKAAVDKIFKNLK